MLNPDVTVRGQGVMEKCTFCVQRDPVGAAGREERAAARSRTARSQTACQQTCPTGAITFGNLKRRRRAPRSRRPGRRERAYHALHMLNTRPAVTYLAKVQRGEVEES